MKKIFITLEDTLIDPSGVMRPGTGTFIEVLKSMGFQVYVWSDRGMVYAERVWEKHNLPAVHGFFVRGEVDRQGIDYVVDSDPSFIKRYNGSCIKEWNSLQYDPSAEKQLKDVLEKIKVDIF